MQRTRLVFSVSLWLFALTQVVQAAPVTGWLDWRGPHQIGISDEQNVPETISMDDLLYSYEMRGRGTPVIANGTVYAWGYNGEGPDMREYLVALDEATGDKKWELAFNDFISDTIYSRYGIGAPTVDAETGNIYLHTTAGLMNCISPDGEILWQHSLMEKFGRLTFPNGRTGAPVIDGDLVITHCITSNWGANGPARDRFYAFDKVTGDLVWESTPGVRPLDSSFSTPVFEWRNGKRLFYAGTGCGNIVCVNARTGEPVWRFQMSMGGVNSGVVLLDDMLVAIHGKENIDASSMGRMVGIKLGAEPAPGEAGPVVLDESYELWRQPLEMFTSSPVLVDGYVYQVVKTGELVCVEAKTGEIMWSKKLSNSQLHASPLYADGKLFVPMLTGSFFIINPSPEKPEILTELTFEGQLIGSPAIYNGKLYQFTTNRLYVFDLGSTTPEASAVAMKSPAPGEASRIQIIPSQVLAHPGDTFTFRVHALDANGIFVTELDADAIEWESFVPPTARTPSELDAEADGDTMTIPESASLSAGAFKGSIDGMDGFVRGRILPNPPFIEDFESYELTGENSMGEPFAFPPLPWIGARMKFEIVNLNGDNVLAKTLDNVLFQRAMSFIGLPDAKNYTMQADIMTDGNRRTRSTAGLINQRYLIALLGNQQAIEISSNQERIKVSVPFRWSVDKWYTLKSRVDVNEDGSGVVRAKAWPRDEEEPDNWLIEVPHANAHTHGAPGFYGFSPQVQFRVYLDNLKVTPNE